jgi:hypothetical protein
VLAAPLPKYYKGTAALERGGNAIGRDTIPILANEGEAIIPTDVNRKYPGLASAWIKNDLDRYILNQFVSPALTKQKEVHERLIQDRMAVINEDSLSRKIAAELEYRLRGDKVVGISNDSIKKLAGVISSDYNPRRV